jgi:tRNA modification GTPase
VLYLWPTDRSYTCQPMGELHVLGSPPLVQAALRAVCAAGARLAEPGEFTMRAFLAGRLDLPQAEAVLAVIDAASQRELNVALTQLAGGLSGPLGELRDRLLNLLADLEAGLDFVDEDIEFVSDETLVAELEVAVERLKQIVARLDNRTVERGAARVVLYGYPNVGKSSLLNALAADNASIVTKLPGTTRDYVIRRLRLCGVTCELIDTAGVDSEPDDPLSQQAAGQMTKSQAERAHLKLLCLDASRPLNTWERGQLAASDTVPRLLVLTKSDLPRRTDLRESAVETSSRTGAGLAALAREIANSLSDSSTSETPVVSATSARCRDSLRLAEACLRRAHALVQTRQGEELVAAEVRVGLDELGKVVGSVYTEDVLDRIFSRFCIGK